MERGRAPRMLGGVGRLAGVGSALLLALGAGSRAEPALLTLDPEEGEIRFRLGATLHTVRGSLRLASGEVELDLERGAISGRVALDARSAQTGIAARDRRMHEEVLESDRFPEIVFLPRELRGLRRAGQVVEAEVAGVVRIRGLERDLVVPLRARFEQSGGAWIEGSFAVPYLRWGLRDVSSFLLRVEPEVQVSVKARASLR